MGNVVDSLQRLGLNGITVHWVEAHAGCNGPDEVTVLKNLLQSFRTWFNDRMLPDVMITVILELNRASQVVVQEAADVVDHFFLATQDEGRNNIDIYFRTCGGRTEAMHDAYRMFVSALPSQKLQRSQLCLSDRLIPSVIHGRLVRRGTALNFAYVRGIQTPAPIHLECSWPNVCQIPQSGASCVVHFAQKVTMDRDSDRMFLIDGASEVQKRLNFTEINATTLASAPGDSSQVCVLLHDLDADNYVDQCGSRFARYALMRNYYYGSVGRKLSGNGDVANTLANCRL
ncbi:hypothetical protein MTO96_047957 [Rhipicephalus appendiculatus]